MLTAPKFIVDLNVRYTEEKSCTSVMFSFDIQTLGISVAYCNQENATSSKVINKLELTNIYNLKKS